MRIGEFHARLSDGNYVGTIFDRLRRLGTVEDLKTRLLGLTGDPDDGVTAEWIVWANGSSFAVPATVGA